MPELADHRQILDRVVEVVQKRLDHAEKMGLQKLDEIERNGQREFERATRKHEKRIRELERKRRRLERRMGRRSDRSDAEDAEVEFAAAPTDPGDRGRRRSRHRDRGSRRRERSERRGDWKRKSTPEERAYREAQRRANEKLSFYTHFGIYVATLLGIAVAARSVRVALIVGAFWGIGIFVHYFWALLAPQLREQWIEKEVGSRVGGNVRRERERVESRQVRSLEDLSASIAHEIRNPITAAKSLVQQMGEDPVAEDNIEYANVALQELDRVERSISHLLKFAREEEIAFEPIELADIVTSALDTFRDRQLRLGLEVDLQLDTRGELLGDAEKLRRVVINLIGNALDAMEEAGTAEPRLTLMTGDNLAGTEAWLRIQDNGPGIEPERLSKIFDPFFTTKESGTGLGLALSKKVIDSHGGTLEVDTAPSSGTEFVVAIPKDARPADQGDAR